MKFRTRWPISLFLLISIFLLLATRLIWSIGDSSIGWRLLIDDSISQTRSLVKWEPPIALQPPKEQATFWIQQSTKIDAVNRDPQAALGSAWMLDSPQMQYLDRYHFDRFTNNTFDLFPFIRLEPDRKKTGKMLEEFEPLTHKVCLKQSELATSLAPDDKELWRHRALLLFQLSDQNRVTPTSNFTPRSKDWLVILDECARHDPENALYDYLAAIQFWSTSIKINREKTSDYGVIVTQPETYKRAQQRLHNGLKKPFLKSGFSGSAAIFTFLAYTPVIFSDQLIIAENRNSRLKEQILLAELKIFLNWEFTTKLNQKKYEAAVTIARDQIRISDQLSVENTYHYISSLKSMILSDGLINLLSIQKANSEILKPTEVDSISERLSQDILQGLIFDEVLRRDSPKTNPNQRQSFFKEMLLAATSLNFVLITLGCSLMAGLLSWICGQNTNSERVRMGLWRPAVCWILGISISLFLWGVFPTEIVPLNWETKSTKLVPLRIQFWLLPTLIWTGLALFVIGFLYLLRVGFTVPWSQLFSLLIIQTSLVLIIYDITTSFRHSSNAWQHTPLATLIAFGFVMLLAAALSLRHVRNFMRDDQRSQVQKFVLCGLILLLAILALLIGAKVVSVSPNIFKLRQLILPVTWRDIGGMYDIIGIPNNNFEIERFSVLRFWLIWYWHAGELFAALIALTILFFWYLKRQSKTIEGGFATLVQNRKRIEIRNAGQMLAKSCATTALLFSLVYLTAIPDILQPSKRQARINYQKLINPAHDQKQINALYAELQTDQALMKKLEKEAAQRKQQIMDQIRTMDQIN